MGEIHHEHMAKVLDEQRKDNIKALLRLTDDTEVLNKILVNLPVIIDPYTEDGDKALASFKKNNAIKVLKDPFITGHEEIKKLYESFVPLLKILEGEDVEESKEILIDYIQDQLMVNVSDPLLGPLVQILQSRRTIVDDLIHFVQNVQISSLGEEEPDENSRWIWYPYDHRVVRFLDPERYRILLESRNLCCLPLDSAIKLKDIKIYVMGAKRAEEVIKTLVKFGAEHIIFTEDESAMLERPAYQLVNSSSEDGDIPYTLRLQNELYRMNPYGFYYGFSTGLIPSDEDQEPDGLSIQSLVKEADLVIDTTENLVNSINLRSAMQETAPETPILFFVENGSDALAGIEIPGNQKYFNLNTPDEDWKKIRDILAQSDNGSYKQAAYGAIFDILGDHKTPKGSISALVNSLGLLPDLLLGGTSLKTTHLVVQLLLEFLSGNQRVAARNFTPAEMETFLVENLDTLEQITVSEVCDEYFMPVRTFTPEFKAQVVLELLKGEKTMENICQEHQLKVDDVLEWRVDFIKNASRAFSIS